MKVTTIIVNVLIRCTLVYRTIRVLVTQLPNKEDHFHVPPVAIIVTRILRKKGLAYKVKVLVEVLNLD